VKAAFPGRGARTRVSGKKRAKAAKGKTSAAVFSLAAVMTLEAIVAAFGRDGEPLSQAPDLPRFSLPVVIWKFGFHTTVS
jgi:hypothetical protein